MLSHYGWLKAYGHIDHPLAGKHFGRIYIQKKDVVNGECLKAGDAVSFYIYADHVGLGAEACRVETKEADLAPVTALRADAAEFVPGAAQAPVSDVFLRMSRAFGSIPVNGCAQLAAFNSAYFDSDSSSEEGDDDSSDADKESVHEESDHSSCEDVEVARKALVACPPWTKAAEPSASCHPWRKVKRPMSPDDESTSPGLTSDCTNSASSDSDSEICAPIRCAPPGQTLATFRPPLGFRPPPGLEEVVLLA
jgi:hypothetical protein